MLIDLVPHGTHASKGSFAHTPGKGAVNHLLEETDAKLETQDISDRGDP